MQKNWIIIILSLIICGFCVYTFGVAGPDFRELTERLDNSIIRAGHLARAASLADRGASEIKQQLDKERVIIGELQSASAEFERLYKKFKYHYSEQRTIIEKIEISNKYIDTTITNIESRVNRIKGAIADLRETSE